jgi:hypothetical protein
MTESVRRVCLYLIWAVLFFGYACSQLSVWTGSADSWNERIGGPNIGFGWLVFALSVAGLVFKGTGSDDR